MEKSELKEIKKGKFGTGLLIENDGYISLDTEKNKYLIMIRLILKYKKYYLYLLLY